MTNPNSFEAIVSGSEFENSKQLTREEAENLLKSGHMEDASSETWEMVDAALRQPSSTEQGGQNA